MSQLEDKIAQTLEKILQHVNECTFCKGDDCFACFSLSTNFSFSDEAIRDLAKTIVMDINDG